MQATITYLLTEQAQRAQMAITGQPVARKQVHMIDVDNTDLPYLAVAEDGSLSQSLDYTPIYSERITPYDSTNPAAAWARYRSERDRLWSERQAVKDKATAEQAERERALIAADPAIAAAIDALPTGTSAWDVINRQRQGLNLAYAEVSLPLSEAAAHRLTVRNDAKCAAETAAAAARETAKQEYMAEWVATHCDEMLRAQFADGLASRAEILRMIADAAFANHSVWADCGESAVCQDRDCPCRENTVDVLSTEAYATWHGLKPYLPDGTTVEFSSVRDCRGDCTASEPYYVATLHMPHGPFRFDRRIRL